ncbi:MAG: Acylphosphatase [Methanosaeta sp. PtaU1.Bin112]|nr:MAG: Acylphosphatase [Methanosaeta sp. PtaU1.Bin112]
MKRLTALVSGKVQRVGYRARITQLANGMGLKGFVENLSDGRVRIIVEGDDEKIKLFEEAIDIKNTFIQVTNIGKNYSQANDEFSSFYKLVGTGETDSRLDEGIGILKDMRDLLISICDVQKQMLGKQDQMLEKQDQMLEKQDQMLEKQDQMLGKQDQMLGKQEETILEIKDMNQSLNDKMDRALDRSEIIELKSDVSEMKSALKAKGII